MNSLFENENTWVFSRTEADQLEDWYNEFLEGDSELAIEDEVLEEQRVIEATARQSMSHLKKLVEKSSGEVMDSVAAPIMAPANTSLRSLLRQSSQTSALHQEAVRWAKETAGWARELYPSSEDPEGNLFRVALHAMVVPSKIRFAQEEERSADQFGAEFAHLEYRLAQDYLKAALKALRLLPRTHLLAQSFYANGCLLKEQLTQARRQLESRHAFRLRRL